MPSALVYPEGMPSAQVVQIISIGWLDYLNCYYMAVGVQIKKSIRISVYIVLVIVGVIVLAWPEEDNVMLVEFNESHGPSMLDSVGLAFIFAGYLPMVLQVIRNFSSVMSRIGKTTTIVLGGIILLSGICIGLALINQSDLLLWTSVAVCTLGEATLIFYAFKVSQTKDATQASE
jgi:hypothetical protein